MQAENNIQMKYSTKPLQCLSLISQIFQEAFLQFFRRFVIHKSKKKKKETAQKGFFRVHVNDLFLCVVIQKRL